MNKINILLQVSRFSSYSQGSGALWGIMGTIGGPGCPSQQISNKKGVLQKSAKTKRRFWW